MTMIDKNTVLFTYGEDNEHKQTVGTFLELVKNEDGEKLYSIGETLESEGKSLGKELNEIAEVLHDMVEQNAQAWVQIQEMLEEHTLHYRAKGKKKRGKQHGDK
ncbi:hypothetical protein MKM94_07030 [Streptococcus suis]|nr:hypothetical protein [Streptococcus suis]MDG3312750.1 hypothetical protein [Streptococcus suis]